MPLACNHPWNLTSPRKLTKLPPRTDWLWTPKTEGSNSLPSWQGWEVTVYRVQYTFNTSDMSNITLYTMLCKCHKHCLIAFDLLLIIGTMFHTSDTAYMPFYQYYSILSISHLWHLQHQRVIRLTMQILIQSIRIRAEFELKPCNNLNSEILWINGSNYSHFKLDTS